MTSRNGSPIDWPSILAQHDRWLRTVLHARVGESQAVDELLQEVALAAVRQAAPIADPAKVAPWLYRLAVRQALLYRRSAGRRRKLVANFAREVLPAESDSRTPEPLAWLLADERQRLVREALERLARGDREILLLKYSEDWSYQELATHLGVSHSAAEARLHRARGRLRAMLVAMERVPAGS